MEQYILPRNLPVFGWQEKTFPLGVGEAFDALARMIPKGFQRPYYGISYMNSAGEIIYMAAALEEYEGEAVQHGCERYIIKKGEYMTETISNWREKPACIKDVFGEMMKDARFDNTHPCIEWYQADEEMRCMIKMKEVSA